MTFKRFVFLMLIAAVGKFGAGPVESLGNALERVGSTYTPIFEYGMAYEISGDAIVPAKIFIKKGDMFAQGTRAIVNAANEDLVGGGGVDAAVEDATKKYSGIDGIVSQHWKDGKPNDWKVGKAFLNTSKNMRIAFDHKNKKIVDKKTADADPQNINVMEIIQAVGPQCGNGKPVPNTLSDAFFNSLAVADANGFRSIALPFISGGIFGCGTPEGAHLAIIGVLDYLVQNNKNLREIHIGLFLDSHYSLFINALKSISPKSYKIIEKKL